MSPWPERRSISSARILTGLAADYGVTPEQCLRGTGIPPAHLEDNTREIDARQELRIVDNLLDACGGFRPGMGLAAGLRYHLTSYGIWGYALISSPTLRDAIQMGMRYLDLSFAFVRVRFEEEPDRARLVLDSSAIPSACRAFLLERDMACIIALVEDLFGVRMPLQAAWFTGTAPRDL
ncbi:MAG TPA: AraC family transcriptional regulator, partial [Fluviicoccus sp.]|nr:AraC family transcriptional regulator [Fluviicoccus sp.]